MDMTNAIIIIESPNKCEKIAHYSGAKVYATKGHFMRLKNDDSYINYETYEPSFEMIETKKKEINFILQQCKNKEVYIATDPDREGYAIGYMFYEKIKNIAKSIKRAEFHEITEQGIQKGLQEAKDFSATNKNLYEAYKARAVGDKLVGFLMSPKLMQKFSVGKNVSVGRVQTPALALIVKKAIDLQVYNEQPKEKHISYKVVANALIDNESYTLHNANVFHTKEEAQGFVDSIKNEKTAFIESMQEKESKLAPPKPFQAVTLIKQANIALGMNSNTTMEIAQKLFEKGLITYHRTDSEMLATSFIDMLETHLKEHEWYEKRAYSAGKHSQAEAHEAIHITHYKTDISSLSSEEKALYELIKENSLYSQSKDSIYKTMKYECNILGRIFTINLKAPLYVSIFEKDKASNESNGNEHAENENEENNEKSEQIIQTLPALKEKDTIALQEFSIKEVRKSPPKPYKESDFIPLLQKEGIGRPSTYASFIPKLLEREFVKIEKKGKKEHIVATEKGIQAINYLEAMQDTWITTSEFTRSMEEVLDLITESKASYLDFIKPLHAKMGNAIPSKRETIKPTEKQIELATKIAKEKGIDLPKEVLESMRECSNFIDSNKSEYPPTQKQLEFAKKIAQTKGIALPKEVTTSSKACSDFITKHKK